MEKSKSYEVQIKHAESLRTQLEEAVKVHDARSRQCEELLKKNREEAFQTRQVADKLRSQVSLLSVRAQEMREENERMKKALDVAKDDCAELRTKLSKAITDQKRSEEKLESTTQKLTRMSANEELEVCCIII
jgi:phage shock protein A